MDAYGMNKYEYLDRIVFSIEYKDIKSITVVGNNESNNRKRKSR